MGGEELVFVIGTTAIGMDTWYGVYILPLFK